ncbi:MAG: hypothetical protein NZ988_02255 [Thaumarchaeota archaeon]|nr:hypothetical protein [Candidatus Calditenuaceae archaeon]MDW8186857.1 hypothetical protein [Nitrososphaerota archaeon]
MPRRIVSMKPLTITEVKELLEQNERIRSPMVQRVISYVSAYSKLSPVAVRKLKEELMSFHGLDELEATQVVNICPVTVEELRAVLSGYKRLLLTVLADEERLSRIVETVKKYVGEHQRSED